MTSAAGDTATGTATVGLPAFTAEDAALVRSLAARAATLGASGACATCTHAYSEHLGATGPCTYEDGRGTCSCSSFAELEAAADAMTAAVGDVAWGPEDGFNDLICDVNEILNPGESYRPQFRCIDAAVSLDRVLIADDDGDAFWVAAITIDAEGEPVLSPANEWVDVEAGWIEVPAGEGSDEDEAGTAMMAAAPGRARFLLRFDEIQLPVEPGETLPTATTPGPAAPATPAPGSSGVIRWRATLVPEATETDDGRAIAPGALDWRELPLSLGRMLDTPHADAVTASPVCGRIDRIYRAGNLILGEGVFDEGDVGQETARMVADGTLRGISVDLAVHEYEFGARGDYFDEDGNWLTGRPAAEDAPEDPDLLDLLFGEGEDTVFVITKGTIGAATVCPFQAFRDATIEVATSLSASAGRPAVWTLTHQGGWTTVERLHVAGDAVAAPEETEATLTAAGEGLVPLRPPAEWFRPPDLDELTALTVGDDGRVYGHAWAWETCHTGIPDACVTAPHSHAAYAYFHLKEVECDDGSRVSCGTVTIDAPHADRRLGRSDAAAHYDHTGLAVADVIVGEDEHGGWVAGALRPDASPEKVRALRGAVLSGDWRNVNGNLELIALLAVNVPGFPVPRRPQAVVASGENGPQVLALVAAGIHVGPDTPRRLEPAAAARVAALADQAQGRFAALADRARQA